jgi:hypothetical protein
MVALKNNIGGRSATALHKFRQSPVDRLEDFQKEIGIFFDALCENLENSGRLLLKTLDLRCDVLNSLEIKIRGISGPFQRREDVAGQRVIELMQKPTVQPLQCFQPVPDTEITYESIYRVFPPGSPIRLNVIESVGAFGSDEQTDLVFIVPEGGR